MFSNISARFGAALPLMLVVLAIALPDTALAYEDAAAVSERIESNLAAIKSLVLSIMFLVGLVLFGLGIFWIYKDSKQPNQGHAKNGMIAIFVGVLLLAVPTVVGIMGSTVLGGDNDAVDNITTDSGW